MPLFSRYQPPTLHVKKFLSQCLAAILIGLLFPAASLAADQNQKVTQLASLWSGEKSDAQQRAVPFSQLRDMPRALRQAVTLRLQGATLEEALRHIAEQTGLKFIYGQNTVVTGRTLSVELEDVPAHTALERVLRDTGRTLVLSSSGQLVLIEATAAPAASREQAARPQAHARPSLSKVQAALPKALRPTRAVRRPIEGTVTDADTGEPLPGVNVLVQGTQVGTATNADGRYSLDVPASAETLVFSFVGYQTREVALEEGRSTYDVALQPAVAYLDEAVVIGYGTAQQKNLTGAVSSIRAEELESLPSTMSPVEALQGQAAGVSVALSNGQPGSAPRVRIRGTSSLTGSNEPLYVVDGVPIVQASNIPFDVSTRSISNLNEDLNELGLSSPMANLSIGDIKSIDILKGASAAAIYGSRAANGVVIITTKRGGKQEPRFSGEYSIETQTAKTLDVLDVQSYREIMTEAAQNNPTYSDAEEILDPENEFFRDANTDWEEEVEPAAPVTHNFTVSSSGGSELLSYLASFTALNRSGVIEGSGFEKYSGRVNLDFDLSSRLRFGTNLNLSYSNQDASDPSLVNRIYSFRPDIPVRSEDGSFATVEGSSFQNPVALTNARNNNETYLLLGSAFGQFDIIEGLLFESRLSLNYNNGQQESFYPGYLNRGGRSFTGAPGAGYGQESNSTSYFHLFENTLNYDNTFADKHSVSGVIGASWQGNSSDYTQAAAEGFPEGGILTNLSSASEVLQASSYATESGLVSYFSRLQYGYDDRYLLSVSGRFDESTRFAPENERGFFPTAAAAWRLSEESFMQGADFLSNLKLRASVGVTGQQDIGPYQWRSLFVSETYAGLPATVQSTLGNEALKWETTTQYDAGLDFALFNSRLRGTLGYYVKNTEDALYVDTPPGSTGFTSISANIGDVQNRGLEFELEGDYAIGEDFRGTVGGNISFNRSKLTKLNTLDFDEEDGVIRVPGGAFLREGEPLGLHYGYVVEGIIRSEEELEELNARAPEDEFYQDGDTAPGDFRFKDLNGDGIIDSQDQKVIGNAQPDFLGGLSSSFAYKGVQLDALFTYSVGSDILWLRQRERINVRFNPDNLSTDVLDRWTPENRDADQPRVVSGDPNRNARTSDYYVHDGSYLRLQNLRLAYTLPASLTQGAFGGRVQVYARATNLFTLTGYPGPDPANSVINYGNNLRMGIDFSRYPLARSYGLGVRMNF